MCLSVTAFWVAKSELTPGSLKDVVAEGGESFELAIASAGRASLGEGAEKFGVGASGLSLLREGSETAVRGGAATTGALVCEGWPPSASARRSRKSVSNRPLEGSTWYPEFAEAGSAYQAVILALTRTSAPPVGVELTWISH